VLSRRAAVATAVLGLFACLGIAITYRSVGAGGAVSLGASFVVLAAFRRWASKRVAAWRLANPSAQRQPVPLSAFGGPKAIVLIALLITFLMVVINVLFHVLRI
jgi:hypothetical protein